MQANSQHSGQLQNLHGEGTTPGNGRSQNFYQLCLPPPTASPSYSGQTATGNYFTCTVQPATSDQILASGVQATKGTKLAQENQPNANHMLPTGKQDSQIILWNMPSNCQIFLPVNNINLQGAPNNNGPNMTHCAFNSTNSLYMQPQTTSSAAGPHNLQQFKTIDTQSLNEPRINVNTSNLHSRQQYANAPTKLPKDSSKTRKSLPSNLNYCPPTENAHLGQSSLFGGYLYQLLFAENTNNANVQMLSTCAQNLQSNNAAQRAVAVVPPLSPIGTAPVNVLDKSANVKMNVNPVQETVHLQPNIPHPLVSNANLMNQTGEPNDPTSKHQRPKSAEPRLNDGLCNVVGAKSPVLANESTDQSPNLKCVVAEQNESVPAQMQNESAEKMNKNCTVMDKKTIDPDTVPFIEWPLDRLQTLMAVIQQIENGDQKNIHITDPGKDILKLYWNGDTRKFSEVVESGIYQSIMEEVYIYSPMNEPVILRQIVNDARSKVIENFHVLKHNEVPPKMTYTSSWLNLNENVDDIDKECGYSWFYKSFQNVPEHEAQNSACEAPSKLQEATEKPSLIGTKQLPSAVENKVPADEPASNKESLHETVPISFNGQSSPVANINCSPKHNCQVTELTNSQPIIAKSLEAMVDLGEQGVPTGKSSLDNQFGTKSVLSPKSIGQNDYTNSPKPIHVVAKQQEIALSSEMQVRSSQKMLNECAVLDKNVRYETTPKPSQETPVQVNELETDKMDSSATKMNVLPHEMARQCFANEMKGHQIIAAFPDKHKAPLLNTTQVLDTKSTEEPISRQKLEEKAKYSASRVLALLSEQYKSSLAEHIPFTDKVQQEQISSKKNMYDEIREESSVPSNAQSPSVIDNVSPKFNEQPNTVNPLNSMRNLVRTLEKRNVSLIKYKKLFEKHGGLKKHKKSSRTSKLDTSFGNSVGAQSPILIDETSSESDCTIEASTLSPVVEKRQFVPLTQVQNESSEMMLYSKIDKTLRCETDPKPCQELHVQINDEKIVEMDASSSFKLDVLTQEMAKRCFAENKDIAPTPKNAILRLDDPLCNRAKSPVLAHGSTRQIDYARPPKLYPVLTGPSQMRNESDEEMPEIDCVLTEDSMRCETESNPSLELSMNMNEEEFVEMDASASIKINVLPHEVAMQCFADQMIEDKDIAAPLETMHRACLLNSPQDTVSTKEQINMWRMEGTDGAKSPVLTEGSTSQSICASPPKLDPVIKEPSQVQNKSNEEMPEIDCMLTDDSVRCKTDPKPSQELPVNMNEEETEKIDGLDSIKIDVFPHEMAKLWFAGETEGKDLQKDTTVHNSTEDQVKVQVLELDSEKVLLEDVKPKERKYPSSGGEQLESYCCLAKWFQTLEHGNGSLCMCQIKAESREKEIQIEAHRTSLEVQAEKDSPGDCERVEMDAAAALERTDDSEATDDSEDENPWLHDPTTEKTKIAKDISTSEEVSKAETETSEQKRSESPTKCATNMTLMNVIEQDTPAPDLKETKTVCLALYGSSSEKENQLKLTKRCKEKSSREEPPKTLQIIISSHQKVKNNSESKKRICMESEDEDATDRRKRIRRASLQSRVQRKSFSYLVEGNKRKRRHKHTTQQMSMNKYITRGKTVPSKLLHSPVNVKKSKYELGNPALMPLDEGPALEFKVLPETFTLEDGAELNCDQADTSQTMQNEMSGPEEKAERKKTSHVPTQGVWSFSPLKKKCTQPIQDTDVSGSCSLFQEFKKKYQEKKGVASKQNLNSSERA